MEEKHITSSLDNRCGNSSTGTYCKLPTENNVKAYPDNEKCFNAISNTKLICKINIEFEKMKNRNFSNYLVNNFDSTTTVIDANKKYSDTIGGFDFNDFCDDLLVTTEEEMRNEFMRGCGLFFDTFKEKVFDTVYSDYLASVSSLRHILRY